MTEKKTRDQVIDEMTREFIELCRKETEDRYGPNSTVEEKNFIVNASLIYELFEAIYDIASIKEFLKSKF